MEVVKKYLLDDMEVLKDVVNELNSWNDCLDNLRVYENDEEFFEMMFEGKPYEAVRATFYGKYNYNDCYVRFNGYGNLESLSSYDYEEKLVDNINNIVDNLLDNIDNIDIDDDLKDLINAKERLIDDLDNFVIDLEMAIEEKIEDLEYILENDGLKEEDKDYLKFLKQIVPNEDFEVRENDNEEGYFVKILKNKDFYYKNFPSLLESFELETDTSFI